MDLIIGGKSQGKLDFALTKYNLTKNDVSDSKLYNKKIIYNFQQIVKKLLQENADPYKITEDFVINNADVVIICDEIGCGLVPIDKFEREYRDVTGKICCELAKKAQNVYRVQCGIATKIK